MSFPATIPVFTTLADDVDFILAADQNDPNDVITSIATMLGAVGAAQSYSIDVLDFLSNKQAPILTKASTSTLSLSAGAIVIKNAAQSKRYLKRNTAAVTITAANIDTGSMAVGYYYVYVIGDAAATTFTVVFSTSATNPAVASGLIYELVAWFYNESAGSIDVTSGFVGNVKKNGRDVPNSVSLSGTDAQTHTSTSFVALSGMTLRFYSSGRPLLISVFVRGIGSSNNVVQTYILDYDGTEPVPTTRYVNIASTAGESEVGWGQIDIASWPVTLAVGTHTIALYGKTASGTGTIKDRHIVVTEL